MKTITAEQRDRKRIADRAYYVEHAEQIKQRVRAYNAKRMAERGPLTKMTPLQRLWSKTLRSPVGCWIWNGARGPSGHGVGSIDRKARAAHRLAWMLNFGPIPKGMQVHHVCKVPQCVRPTHMILVRPTDHAYIHLRERNPRFETHCNSGHERIPSKECPECRRARNREWYARNAEAKRAYARERARKIRRATGCREKTVREES